MTMIHVICDEQSCDLVHDMSMMASYVLHTDVTFNVCLGKEPFTGAGLTFCGVIGTPQHRQFNLSYKHVIGRCVVHLGRQRHGADDIKEGISHTHTKKERTSGGMVLMIFKKVPPLLSPFSSPFFLFMLPPSLPSQSSLFFPPVQQPIGWCAVHCGRQGHGADNVKAGTSLSLLPSMIRLFLTPSLSASLMIKSYSGRQWHGSGQIKGGACALAHTHTSACARACGWE